MPANSFTHDPEAVLAYAIDWSDCMVPGLPDDHDDIGEYLIASTFQVDSPIQIVSTNIWPEVDTTWLDVNGKEVEVKANTFAVIWITGMLTPSQRYAIVNHTTTNQGGQDDRTIYVTGREK